MSYGSACLTSIIEVSFGGKKNRLSEAANMRANVITKLTIGGQALTQQTLAQICAALDEKDAKRLCIAAFKDLVPAEFSSTHLDRTNQNEPFPFLNNETRDFIVRLAEQAETDPKICDWLRTLGSWIFPKEE